MKKYSEKNYYINTPEYDRHFWDAMRGETYVSDTLSKGVDNATGGFTLPSGGAKLYQVRGRSLLR